MFPSVGRAEFPSCRVSWSWVSPIFLPARGLRGPARAKGLQVSGVWTLLCDSWCAQGRIHNFSARAPVPWHPRLLERRLFGARGYAGASASPAVRNGVRSVVPFTVSYRANCPHVGMGGCVFSWLWFPFCILRCAAFYFIFSICVYLFIFTFHLLYCYYFHF
ncbi:hypothetical protein TRVL_06570 [Trypanosoma vivax]|nr:hypothetical protein TRVL_06570 [Trypanosoma vivax]